MILSYELDRATTEADKIRLIRSFRAAPGKSYITVCHSDYCRFGGLMCSFFVSSQDIVRSFLERTREFVFRFATRCFDSFCEILVSSSDANERAKSIE